MFAGGRNTPVNAGVIHADGALPAVLHPQQPLRSPYSDHAMSIATPAGQMDGSFTSSESPYPHFTHELQNVLATSPALAGLGCAPNPSMISNLNLGLDGFCQQLPSQSLPQGGSSITPSGILINSTPPSSTSTPCSLYVKNLPAETDRLFLYERFAPHGAIHSVKVLSDAQTGKCKGVGFVNYGDAQGAFKAIDALHGSKVGDKFLHVSLQTHKGCPG